MNVQWTPAPPHHGEQPGGTPRSGTFDLEFLRHGDRTTIGRQFVSYPFHLTRSFRLDPPLPQLTTVYQQSSSGGLYRNEQLRSRYRIGPRAAAHVTTQAATIVHDCQGQPATQRVDIVLEDDAFLALTPDPLVLFPGASCVSELNVKLAASSVFMLADAFAQHDPKVTSHPFDAYISDVTVRDADGKLLVRDLQRITGIALAKAASPIGRWSIVSSFMLLGDMTRLPSKTELGDLLANIDGAAAGVSELPNAAGYGVRCLADDAIAARRVAERLFSICVRAALGNAPAPRRK